MVCLPSPQMEEEKIYKRLEPGLTNINKQYIAMETDEKSACVKITLQVLDELIKKMKEASKLFEWLFNRVTYVGSYFDGLRVKEATEFDINVVLKLPLIYEKIRLTRTTKYPGFIEVNLNDAKHSGDKLTKHQNETLEIFKWVNQDGKLSHRNVLQWWESVFSKLQGLTTLVVESSEYREGVWYIVPKPREENEFLWRLSFPVQERDVMNGLNKLKMVNRFMKRVRDVFDWRPLASYYIKSIFLWEAYERKIKNDEAFFNKNLGFLFAYFLGKLQGYLEQGNLPFFWDEDMNLLINIKRPTLDQYAARTKKVKAQMEKFILEDNEDGLQKLIKSVFCSTSSSDSRSDAVSKANDTFLLIDLEPMSGSSEPSGPLPSTELFPELGLPSTELFPELGEFSPLSLQPFDPLSSPETRDSAITSTVNFSTDVGEKRVLDLEAVKEKSSLEIEECKIRIQIAQIDLKTATMNLKAAEKRYEKIDLEFKMASKINDGN